MRAPITAIMTQAAGGTFAADHQASVWGHCADEKFSELIHRAPHPCCHCQKFKLPVRSDNRHSHSHTSRPATRNLTLPILAMPFHDDDGALGQQSSTRRHLLSDPGGSLRLCFHWGCPLSTLLSPRPASENTGVSPVLWRLRAASQSFCDFPLSNTYALCSCNVTLFRGSSQPPTPHAPLPPVMWAVSFTADSR